MARRPIIAGNWKMHLTIAEGLALAAAVRDRCNRFREVDVLLGPPATALYAIGKRLEGSRVGLAAQNCHHADKGAYTGELSPVQLADAGCTHVIIGHSERRTLFGETDAGVAKKARSLHDHGLVPIICVGETLAEREANQTKAVVARQIAAALAPLSADELARSVIAYEPVWAIGTGKTATPEQAQDVHAAIRRQLAEIAGPSVAEQVRIQYGGSVKPDNIRALMAQPDIDGALVGGASLDADGFARIVAFEEDVDR
ncbi:MAG: triose-phosphate isomerase [Myxococcales bacterium]|nr:triose-phosphate isomerase [Myxococcales bacterium]